MSSTSMGEVRIHQTAGDIGRLAGDIADWVERRRRLDVLQQYATQLRTLDATLGGAAARLRDSVAGLSPHGPAGAVYDQCRAYDRRAALVRRAWDWYRAKFDQRDDEALRPMLAAADEVVWSCHAEAFINAERRRSAPIERPPAPLPYIDAHETPEAVPRDAPPPGLRADATDAVLGAFLAKLPVPVVSLPACCTVAPWLLVLLGHEVAHHLQYDLVPDWALISELGDELARVTTEHDDGLPETDPEQWRRWSREIFADACSVVAMGPAAILAVVELELADELSMLSRGRALYPPPVVRLELMAEIAGQLGLDGRPSLAPVDPRAAVAPRYGDALAGLRRLAADDMAHVPRVAAGVLRSPLCGLGPLPRLFRFAAADFQRGGAVDRWAAAFERGTASPEPSLRAARLVSSGALVAWSRSSHVPDAGQRSHKLQALAATVPAVLAASREEPTRAGLTTDRPADLAGELERLLAEAVPTGGDPS